MWRQSSTFIYYIVALTEKIHKGNLTHMQIKGCHIQKGIASRIVTCV